VASRRDARAAKEQRCALTLDFKLAHIEAGR